MEYELRCMVYPGQFSSEYAVEGMQADGERFSLFAPAQKVEVEEAPTRERLVDGWLKVTIWENHGDRVVVRLPRESLEGGRFVTVGAHQFRTRPEPIRPAPVAAEAAEAGRS